MQTARMHFISADGKAKAIRVYATNANDSLYTVVCASDIIVKRSICSNTHLG